MDLISRKAAIESIAEEKRVHCGLSTGFPTKEHRAVARAFDRAILDVQEVPPPWVSVKSRLPELNKFVLLQFPSNMAVGYMGSGYWSVASGGGLYTDVDDGEEQPTHWMELPDPPHE